MIEALSHITLIVKDIDRTSAMVLRLFKGREIYDSGNKTFSISRERYFDINGIWFVLMEGNSLNEKTYNHIAFKVDENALPDYELDIRSLGLEIKPSRARNHREGKSIYFYDYDNDLFELHTGTLDERLKFYSEEKLKA